MPLFLPGLAVVFVGIVGGDQNSRVEQQVQLLLQEQDVKTVNTPAVHVRSLARRDKASREIVRQLHVDGVVGGELLLKGGKLTLRLVVYDADGGLKSLTETPMLGRSLSRDSLLVLESNLGDDVKTLNERRKKPSRSNEARVAPAPVRRSPS